MDMKRTEFSLTPEHEATRMSVCIRNALLLGGLAFAIGGVGLSMVALGAVGGELILGIGVGFFFATGVVALDALRRKGRRVHCFVRD